MTQAQKVQVKQSELRSEIGKALAIKDEDRSETWQADIDALTERAQVLESELRAALVLGETDGGEKTVETETGAEDRELRELEQRADIGGIFDATISGGVTSGAEAELQQHLGMAANQVPLALLHRDEDMDDLERRTTGVTPAPAAGSIGAMQKPIIPFVFPQSASAFMRIPQPSVGIGEQVYTVLSTAAAPGTPNKGADQASSIGAFTAKVLSPGRIQASVFYAREDAARLRGMGESLRMNLNGALADELDKQVLQGTKGLLTGTNLDNNNATAADTFETYRQRFAYSNVDGSFAMTAGDIRIVLGSESYSDMAASYRGNASDMDALTSLMRDTGGVRVSGNMVAATGTPKKQNGILRRGGRMDAVTPIWDGVTMIVDEVTQAKAGEIVLTAIMLYAFDIVRKAGFVKVQSQHA